MKPVILCVDDEKDVLDSLRSILLHEFGNECDFEFAETGEEAIEIFKECKAEKIEIALVIADYIMPGLKGDELLIYFHKKNSKMIKILLTGQATLAGVTNSFENANLYRYIAKPWETKDFILTIREALLSYNIDKSLQKVINEKMRLLTSIKLAEKKYRGIFENAVVGIFQTTLEGDIVAVNPALAKILGYESTQEALFLIKDLRTDVYCNPDDRDRVISLLMKHQIISEYELTLFKKDRTVIWAEIHSRLVYNNKGELEGIEGFLQDISEKKKAREELEMYHKHLEELVEERTREIEKKNRGIMESIRYASRIQESILPDPEVLEKYLKEFFVIWQPMEVVGGDFYWFEEVKNGFLIGVNDCTGHGVPGAFMTMMGRSIFNNIISHISPDNPAVILKEVNKAIKKLLKQDDGDSLSDDGMDAGICFIDRDKKKLTYAGARISLFCCKDDRCFEVRGDRHSLGYTFSRVDYDFQNHSLVLDGTEIFYLTSDGFLDQPGGEKQFGFGRKRFKQLLAIHHRKSMDEQKVILKETSQKYLGNHLQRDDITVIGFRL